ncbi:MAG: TRAM domain-containing protein [Nitriliruptoraceae bacterium]
MPREHVVAELVRLGVVLSATAAGYALGEPAHELGGFEDPQTTRLVTSMLGALVGYLLGGVFGRQLVRGVQGATTRLRSVPAAQLVAGSIGGTFGALLGLAISVPVLLLPGQRYTVPVLLLLLVVLIYGGVLLGANRAAELGRYIGIRGRLEVRTPSRGAGVKVVDSSALIDGRIADVARTGYLEGTLVIPRFVVTEVERIAADERAYRSALGERGLRTVQVLQDEGLVAVEISEIEVAGVAAVDDQLAALCKDRQGALITTDAALARTAESRGIRVLNPHALADAVRAPVLPGDRLTVTIVREGRERGQGVAYLEDGTMVVIEEGSDRIGDSSTVDVTSIVQTRTGRLLFGSIASDAS